MSNILIRIRQQLKRIIAHRQIPTHVQNDPAIRLQPNAKVKPDQEGIHITPHGHQHLEPAQAVTAIAQQRLDVFHMAPVTDIIRTMFENDDIL